MTRIRAALISILFLAGCRGGPPPAPGAPRVEKFTIPNTVVSFEMVYIPGGRLRPEGPADEVEVKPFWIGKCEVTWDEYNIYFHDPLPDADTETHPSPPYEPADHGMGQGRHPFISGKRANPEFFCMRLSLSFKKKFRLPTEEEWEFACRAGSPEPAPRPLDDYAWYADNSGGKYHEVGLKKPNAFGLHDMLGNVWEYCRGPYSPEDESPVVRGGGWNSPASDCRGIV